MAGRPKGDGKEQETVQPVRFVSRHGRLEITIVHDSDKWNGPHYMGKTPDKIAKFENGVFVTSDPEIIEGMRNHPGLKNGRLFTEVAAQPAAS